MQVTDNKRKTIVGIFIFLGLAIFVLAIFTLGSQKKVFVKSFSVNVVFDDIQGLKTGNNVWFSGVKVGTIKKIQFFGTSEVQVFMNIEEQTHQYIHKDAKASISSDGLIGNKIIVLTSGSPKFPFVEDGDRLKVNTALSTDQIMKTLQVNNENLVAVTTDFKTLSKNLVDGKGAAGALLADEQISENFKSIVENLKNTTLAANKMASELNNFTRTLNTKGGLADKMLTDTMVFSRLQNSVNELQKTTKSASTLTENLNQASLNLNSSDNAAGLLLNDQQTADQVKAIMTNLQNSTKKLDENMEALQSNFLLRGFFKRKAKEKAEMNKE
ncbi:MAG: MCE family protein [Flavobacterium sp.]|nr:MCE family protein [Pedobacter sp.]